MSKTRKISLISKWLGIAAGATMLLLSGVVFPYYFGPPSQVATVNLIDSMGPSAPQGMTVVYNKTLNRMEVIWATLQDADDRNYPGYAASALDTTAPYTLELRTDDGVDGQGLPAWSTVYAGTNDFHNEQVEYGHKYVFRIAGRDMPYENIGDYLASTDDPNNDIYSAPGPVYDLDAMPTAANSSIMLSWNLPLSQSTLNYNIYIKDQNVPLVQGDLTPDNLSFTVPSSTWATYGGRSYQRYEHIPATDLIAGGATIDLAYAVCAVDSEGHEADISSGTGNRLLNYGFESGGLYWTIDAADALHITIDNNIDQGKTGRKVHSGIMSAYIYPSGASPPPWDTIDLKVAVSGWPKAYAGKDVIVSAWVYRVSGYPVIQVYSYDASGNELYLGYEYFDTIGTGWQQITYTAVTSATDVHFTETIQARFLANTSAYFDDIEIKVPAAAQPTVAQVRDTTPPAQVNNLDAYGKYSINDIYLEWNNPTDNIGVAGYRIYRNSSGQGPVVPTNLASAERIDVSISDLSPATGASGIAVSWINTDPWPGFIYYYGVAAMDDAGNEGTVSNSPEAMSGYPYDTVPPISVTIIEVRFDKSASPNNPPHKIYIEWLAAEDWDDRGNPGQIKHYHIYRKIGLPITSIAGLSPLADVAGSVWQEDEEITPNTTYFYAVTARDISLYPNAGGNEGGFVNTLGVTTDTLAPIFDTSYIAENDAWCAVPGNGSTTSVKNNGSLNKYTNGDTIDIEINLGETGLTPYITANFTDIDNYGFATNITDNGDGKYRITHFIDMNNTEGDDDLDTCGQTGSYIIIQASDQYFNGPTVDATFDAELDNTAPKAP